MIRLWLISVANTSRMASNGHLRSLDRADTSYICIYSTTVSIPFAGAHLFTRITQNGDLPQLWPLRMQTRGHLIQKRPRISTYLSESFSAICWIFSEAFWLSKYEILARLITKWPLGGAGQKGGCSSTHCTSCVPKSDPLSDLVNATWWPLGHFAAGSKL